MLKIGLVGCGRISKKHIEAIAANEDICELVAVADLIPAKMETAAAMYNKKTGKQPRKYMDYKDMLKITDLDIIAIATESGYHAEHALASLEAGKHVLVEKPMALSTSDCNKMIASAEEKGLALGLCHQNRFNPPVQKLRQALQKDKLGRVLSGTACIRWNRNQDYYNQAPWRGTWAMDGGTLMNQCLHNIDLLQWMLGEEAVTVFAQTGNYLRDIEAEDFGAIVIRFANGAIGIVEGSACVYPANLEETLNIFGETGTVCIGGLAVNKIEVWNVPGEDLIDNSNQPDPDTVYGAGHIPLYKDFVKAVQEERKPYIDGRAGKKAVEIILAAYKSQLTGLPVAMPLMNFSTLDMREANLKQR
ncbi:MAG TPA: oxidoreductase [Firmicutes bacterium]|jgi:predicted dehydrogenase|nr:oxidoreductase [Bacillota bacterium]HBS93306.1 oxidoreductase [Bacillota bacterium]HCX78421.1 oxidoreductase [Bacillota bacterium]